MQKLLETYKSKHKNSILQDPSNQTLSGNKKSTLNSTSIQERTVIEESSSSENDEFGPSPYIDIKGSHVMLTSPTFGDKIKIKRPAHKI